MWTWNVPKGKERRLAWFWMIRESNKYRTKRIPQRSIVIVTRQKTCFEIFIIYETIKLLFSIWGMLLHFNLPRRVSNKTYSILGRTRPEWKGHDRWVSRHIFQNLPRACKYYLSQHASRCSEQSRDMSIFISQPVCLSVMYTRPWSTPAHITNGSRRIGHLWNGQD